MAYQTYRDREASMRVYFASLNSEYMIGKIELVDMEFFAHHGCFAEEQIIGNRFLVSFSARADISAPALSDSISDALDYQKIYNIVAKEMGIASHLLENVAYRIIAAVKGEFPSILEATVSIEKMNPPLGGRVKASRVVISA